MAESGNEEKAMAEAREQHEHEAEMTRRDYIRYLLFSLLIFACNTLPQRFLYWIALRLGDLNYFLLDPVGRAAVMSNLRQVLPDASEERLRYEAQWVFRNFAKYLTEFFRFRQHDKAYFHKHVALKGRQYIDEALARGKGCLILSAHLSNWELGGAALSLGYGYKVNVVAAMHRYGRVNELFMRERRASGVNVIDMRVAPRQVIRALRNNEIVCVLGDRDPTEQGVLIDFFGKPCRFPQGPGRFAVMTGTTLVPGFVLRRTNDSFTIVFQPPIVPPTEGTKEEKVRAVTQQFARMTEEAIRDHPEEWGVFYRIWEETWKE